MRSANLIVFGPYISGSEIKAERRKQRLSQTDLGERVGCSRSTIAAMEGTQKINALYCRSRKVAAELGLKVYPPSKRVREHGVLRNNPNVALSFIRRQEEEQARADSEAKALAAQFRQPCDAMTRKGTPCRNLSEPGKRRCRFHGGKSTGPKTAEGKARIAAAQKRRWARWRAGQ